MKLGATFPLKWIQKSEQTGIALSDILYGIAMEDFMRRIENSPFAEYLWLTNEQALGEEAYKKKVKERLEFLYVESGKKNYLSHAVPGQTFDEEVFQLLLKELFARTDMESNWDYSVAKVEGGRSLSLNFMYMGMQVPVFVQIRESSIKTQKRKRKEIPFLLDEKRTYTCLCYSKESILAEALFEIMRKLELVSDMEVYDEANQILKHYSISGRYILEEFEVMGEKEKKVVSMKRLEQVSSYKEYGYMKKRWQQYERNHKREKEDWEIVLERILNFMGPVWKALCENEIFFDDWMPELERFLG